MAALDLAIDPNRPEYRVAEEARRRKLQEDAMLDLQQKHAEATLAQQTQQTQTQGEDQQRKRLGLSLAADVGESVAAPAYKGKTFGQLDPYAQQGYMDRYKPIAGDVAKTWDAAQAQQNPPTEIPGLEVAGVAVGPDGQQTTHFKPKALEEPQFDSFTTPQEVMEKMPASESGMAQQLARHDISITNLSRLPAPVKMRIINAAQVFNPEWKSSDFLIRQKSRSSFTSGPLGNTKTAINTAIHHLDTVLGKADEMNNSGIPALNAAINPIARGLGTKGGKATREFDVAAQLLASELAKIVKGGTPTQMEVREQMRNFSHDLDPSTLRGNIESAVELLSGKLDGLRTQYQDAYGKANEFGFVDPQSRSILKKHGFDPEHIDPTPGGAPSDSATDAHKAAPSEMIRMQAPNGTVLRIPAANAAAAEARGAKRL